MAFSASLISDIPDDVYFLKSVTNQQIHETMFRMKLLAQ
jgi:hypothetical protein